MNKTIHFIRCGSIYSPNSHIIFCSTLCLSHCMDHGVCYGAGPVNPLSTRMETSILQSYPYGTSVYTYIPVMCVTTGESELPCTAFRTPWSCLLLLSSKGEEPSHVSKSLMWLSQPVAQERDVDYWFTRCLRSRLPALVILPCAFFLLYGAAH
jgi:hypothetical protein